MNSDAKPIHITLQGKGGVGKSLAATLLAQYLVDKGVQVDCYDTDPVNDTFSQYAALNVARCEILRTASDINPRVFDGLIKALLGSDRVTVIDNGAATFVPLMAYMVENRVVELLQASARPVILHSVLAGGQAFADTCHGLETLLSAYDAPAVVWVNEYFGPVEREGRSFEQSQLYANHAERIRGIVRIGRGNADTFAKDLELMLVRKMTFKEALESEDFHIMPRQRLKMTRDAIFQQLDRIDM
ncbi:CobQ/CobB/MinD/ParA family nucleotide binding protein [Pseudoduganella lurida]|uniref:CobQ/CobB/MinD/ParA family nucleotide binding protein n=1 Tax=Pseudoduganella lurida TaxID=1036180 RepID=A0A562R688_9BURK|nr:conjugal transfer protein TraL [Pseudoduganella lurida]TWI64373.1 CobQ/CobB/MinD/ParA family nucleotide binding protein [Pseudoduganella lurida]